MSEAPQQPQDGDGGVDIQSGGEGDRREEGKQFSGRDLQQIEHEQPHS